MFAADDPQDSRRCGWFRSGRARTTIRIMRVRTRALLRLVFALGQLSLAACHLLVAKRTLAPQYDKFGASF
jgi:hypothetical protein